jgi:D-alanyl-D-alanine carboxypeptidase
MDAHLPRHARARRAARIGLVFGVAAVAALVVGGSAAVTSALTGPTLSFVASDRLDGELRGDVVGAPDDGTTRDASEGDPQANGAAPLVSELPVPTVEGTPSPTPLATPVPLEDPCADAAFIAALAAHDDAKVIALAGGAEVFRALVASRRAACVPLDDPTFEWMVVNKHRPYDPDDFRPAALSPLKFRYADGVTVEKEAARALTEMVSAAREAGAGRIGVASGFRSHEMQIATYNAEVAARGRDAADKLSARPGHSEHQSGLAADLIACDGLCGAFYSFGKSDQHDWVVAHSWEYGWIVRYETGCTEVTGYQPEPWHLRYIGRDLARAYHQGGWHTLEEFFGLDPAPDYRD